MPLALKKRSTLPIKQHVRSRRTPTTRIVGRRSVHWEAAGSVVYVAHLCCPQLLHVQDQVLQASEVCVWPCAAYAPACMSKCWQHASDGVQKQPVSHDKHPLAGSLLPCLVHRYSTPYLILSSEVRSSQPSATHRRHLQAYASYEMEIDMLCTVLLSYAYGLRLRHVRVLRGGRSAVAGAVRTGQFSGQSRTVRTVDRTVIGQRNYL